MVGQGNNSQHSRGGHMNDGFNCYYTPLDHTNPVGNIKGIEVLAEANVALLQPPGGDEGVDLVALNLVEVLHCLLDLALVGLDVDDEDEGVAVLNELH